jgi:hypothetical protein
MTASALTFLYNIPSWLVLAGAIAVSLVLANGGQLYVHRRFRHEDFVPHNEVGGFIITVVGALYSVLLGFLTVIVWQHFSDARQLVALESAAATDAWHTAVALPQKNRTRVRQDMLAYANLMIQREWPALRHGSFDKGADILLMDAIVANEEFTPADMGQSNAQSQTLQQLSALHDGRQRRLEDNESGVSWFEWLVLIVGAVCVICFCWLFGVKNKWIHLIMTSVVTILIVSMLVLVFELQYPYRADVGIGPGAWIGVSDHIRLMQSGEQPSMRM